MAEAGVAADAVGWIGNCSERRLPWPTMSTVFERECADMAFAGGWEGEAGMEAAWADDISAWDDGSAPLWCRVCVCARSMAGGGPRSDRGFGLRCVVASAQKRVGR